MQLHNEIQVGGTNLDICKADRCGEVNEFR